MNLAACLAPPSRRSYSGGGGDSTAVVRDPPASMLDEIDTAEQERYWERLKPALAAER